MGKFERYAFSAQPSFNEAATREAIDCCPEQAIAER